ncbi:hypothetical protein [Niabella beijingensis]|uniref:hypothetical protein n=1 Tax=Niabella beijingensis TaxID=2872700 RepID=UPI001CBB32E3|nr:hypothetical protein [Niabella beijingensis]MBZ4187308.1 hypothetical protein [Niabella beijingensis]
MRPFLLLLLLFAACPACPRINPFFQAGSVITATDICTLMLYQKLTNWNTYYIAGPNYVCTWYCRNNQLTILTRKAFNKISKGKKER